MIGNVNNLVAIKSKFQVTNRNGVTSTTNTASRHLLYVTSGYVGPRPKERPLPQHPFWYYGDRIEMQRSYLRSYNDGKQDVGSGDVLSLNPSSVRFTPPLDYSGTYARALDKLNDKARGNLDVSVDLAEAHQVHKMLKVMNRVQDYTQTFFKKRFGVVKASANARLEYIYGVKPLAGTLYDAADESLRTVINRSQRFRARASDIVRPKSIMVQSYFGPYEFTDHNVEVKISTTLGVTLYNPDVDISRWTSLNPYSIAWELMPWSFVVDWVYDVGGFLRNLETYFINDFKFQNGFRSDLAAFNGSFRDKYSFTDHLIYPGGTDFFWGGCNGLRFNRSVLTSYPCPQRPRLQANLGSSRLLNGAALLAQFLGRSPVGKIARFALGDSTRDKTNYRRRVNESRHVRYIK